MKNILVVDGSSLLSSCYYGTIPKKLLAADKLTEEEKEMLYKALLHAPDGTYTNAIYAFLKILSKIITEFDYERICFCFDKGREKLSRKKLYPAYKAQRKETPPPLKQQYITIENLLSDLGFTVLYSDEDEADDWAASVVNQAVKEGYSVDILTKDRDYLQLIDDKNNISVFLMQTTQDKCTEHRNVYNISETEKWPDKTIRYTDAICFFEEGCWPTQIPDIKGLQGDSSDNIPGVKQLSAAAGPLLEIYKTVEGIYNAIEAIDAKELQTMWKEQLKGCRSPYNALTKVYEGEDIPDAKTAALLSKQLATMKKNLPVPPITSAYWNKVNKEKFDAWMTRLNIKSIVFPDKSF